MDSRNAAFTNRWICGTLRNDCRRSTGRARLPFEPLTERVVDPDVGATEPIDRLLRIADDEQRARADRVAACVVAGQQQQQLRLKRIGVLELVDQDVTKPLLKRARTGAQSRTRSRARISRSRKSSAPAFCLRSS